MGKTNWEAIGEQYATKSRLTDTFEIGKTQYNTSSAIAKSSYEDQLAQLRTGFARSAAGFDADQSARGIAGSGFGAQNVWNRAIGQGQQVNTLGTNYRLQQMQLNDQLSALNRQKTSGDFEADYIRNNKEAMFQQSLQA